MLNQTSLLQDKSSRVVWSAYGTDNNLSFTIDLEKNFVRSRTHTSMLMQTTLSKVQEVRDTIKLNYAVIDL